MNVIIEVPNEKNWEEVNKLAKQVHKLHVKWRPDLFLDVDEVISKENFKVKIQEGGIYVAKLDDEIVGYITYNIKEKNNPTMRYRKIISVEAICVDERNRGKGIGSLLLEHIKNIGKENNCTDMYLTVNEENKDAIKLYEKFGFRIKNIAYSMGI